MNLFPLVSFDLIDNDLADAKLVEWGHFLGGCNRPFGRQSFGLYVECELISVAVSASTVVETCAGFSRLDVVELARLASHPDHRDLTRVALRLWRKVAPGQWPYWTVNACVSYANSLRHEGDLYRFDGWKRYGDVKGGAKNNWGRAKVIDPKSVWFYELAGVEDTARHK